jgi:hypothetical protein
VLVIMIASGVRRMSTQHERVQEFGWGRQAQAPRQTPWQGWKDIVWRTYK